MEIYKQGKIVHKNKNYLILDSNYTGWLIYVALIDRFQKEEYRKIYIYKHENDYAKTLYGFDSFKEKILFEDLISIAGIGPKIAMSILENNWENIVKIIASGDWNKLSQFNYVSVKSAKQIIVEFQQKYEKFLKNENVNLIKLDEKNIKIMGELEITLKTLGFSKKQIDYAINKVQVDQNVEIMIENAIKLISDAREFRT
ncbi:Holliday junction branch migration protein RuvA [Mycoplasma iguanae]|uniref:Holliday junction branch migration complex subunit RuvA n=1 Tax=Mycoplasma iguanae TaxID=292461 RepID=A0ABY5RAV0_9MOLU|nr:Holliday junction branch migration protein RuvA [Mycoplasma iguanae]UVD81477.1 Holliday junction branch migration protein RuvA [Mycoplasma iguanae]